MSSAKEQTTVLSMGSNIGARRDNIRNAIGLLEDAGVSLIKMASFYTTAPIGYENQDDFINTATIATTDQAPRTLLTTIKRIEEKLGRDLAAERWGPRPIDIDIIFYGRTVMDEADLVIPHPRYSERRFVLDPVNEIASDFLLPDGTLFGDIYKKMIQQNDITCQVVEKVT